MHEIDFVSAESRCRPSAELYNLETRPACETGLQRY